MGDLCEIRCEGRGGGLRRREDVEGAAMWVRHSDSLVPNVLGNEVRVVDSIVELTHGDAETCVVKTACKYCVETRISEDE